MPEILEFPGDKPHKKSALAGTSCKNCGREIDDSGICRCDPDWISPAEARADKQVSEIAAILVEVRDFLSQQLSENIGQTPEGRKVQMCRGCGTRFFEGHDTHHEKCWPYHMSTRITNYMRQEHLE